MGEQEMKPDDLPNLSPEEQRKAMGVEDSATRGGERDIRSLSPQEQMRAMGLTPAADPEGEPRKEPELEAYEAARQKHE